MDLLGCRTKSPEARGRFCESQDESWTCWAAVPRARRPEAGSVSARVNHGPAGLPYRDPARGRFCECQGESWTCWAAVPRARRPEAGSVRARVNHGPAGLPYRDPGGQRQVLRTGYNTLGEKAPDFIKDVLRTVDQITLPTRCYFVGMLGQG
ncbi:hypothetical protein NDU88_001078 [Pleurodeles waltl]|uniref:Uncharacterized protein n=1 Tax=Pleurodeles waltl TaxID=8319 RepID=A0AAV7R9Z5_PLEWA|nr:hypothetical protein NDU88_001078 [Pleurodeles waltl]